MPDKQGQKLTDKEIKRIQAVFAETGNKRATSRLTGHSEYVVRKYIKLDPDGVGQLIAEKKIENVNEVFAELDAQNRVMLAVYKKGLERIDDALDNSKDVQRIATMMGILVDKHTKFFELQLKQKELDYKRREIELKESEAQSGKISNVTEDGLSRSLREEVEREESEH